MSTTLSFTCEKPFIKAIDNAIIKTGLYQSKSDFLRDAAREKLAKVLLLDKHLQAVEAVSKRLSAKVKHVRALSREEKDALAKKYFDSLPD